MRSLARLRPTPSMAVALVALFVALGGVSYAVATIDSSDIVNDSIKSRDVKGGTLTKADVKARSLSGRNIGTATIDSRNLKTGAVRSIDIRNGTIETNDVGANALTGLDIDESSLGTVNSATTAVSAINARRAATVLTVRTIPLTNRDESGGSQVLATSGPFSILGECISSGGNTVAFLRVDTSEDDSSVHGDDEADADFDAAQGALSMVSATDTPGGIPTATGPNGYFNAFAPSGAALTGHVAGWVDASAGASGQCKFHGSMVISG